jgi:hypothetical protein
MASLPPYPGAPRWVKISCIVVGIIVLVIGIMIVTGLGGPHGPGRHMPSDEAGTPGSGAGQNEAK